MVTQVQCSELRPISQYQLVASLISQKVIFYDYTQYTERYLLYFFPLSFCDIAHTFQSNLIIIFLLPALPKMADVRLGH